MRAQKNEEVVVKVSKDLYYQRVWTKTYITNECKNTWQNYQWLASITVPVMWARLYMLQFHHMDGFKLEFTMVIV